MNHAPTAGFMQYGCMVILEVNSIPNRTLVNAELEELAFATDSRFSLRLSPASVSTITAHSLIVIH